MEYIENLVWLNPPQAPLGDGQEDNPECIVDFCPCYGCGCDTKIP